MSPRLMAEDVAEAVEAENLRNEIEKRRLGRGTDEIKQVGPTNEQKRHNHTTLWVVETLSRQGQAGHRLWTEGKEISWVKASAV